MLGMYVYVWVESFLIEFDVFCVYVEFYFDFIMLLFDMVDIFGSGLFNVLMVVVELWVKGYELGGVCVDLGDFVYFLWVIWEWLDVVGFFDVKIVVSNDLFELVIFGVIVEGGWVDVYGVGM